MTRMTAPFETERNAFILLLFRQIVAKIISPWFSDSKRLFFASPTRHRSVPEKFTIQSENPNIQVAGDFSSDLNPLVARCTRLLQQLFFLKGWMR